MAVKLDTYDFSNFRARNRKYNWDSWLDCNIWQLSQEEDFPDTSAKFLRAQAVAAAKRRGLKVRISKVSDTVLVIQAYKPEELD